MKDQDRLIWSESLDLGYCEINQDPTIIYDEATFHRLAQRDKTEIGIKLNQSRLELVEKYIPLPGMILDVGIGAGTFMMLRGSGYGYDINPFAVKLLKEFNIYLDPYEENLKSFRILGLTFFDVLEHIKTPSEILNRLKDQYVFISIPIFKDKKHVLKSPHFKPNEHYWYFTNDSFIKFMNDHNFNLIEQRDDEKKNGRKDINTYVFKKAQ